MKAQKLRGREEIVSARFVFLFILVLILLSSSLAQALEDWDIYSDADIIDGHYNLINIYDTPPDHTTVNMYGGSADFISTFDYSTLNFFNGNAQVGAFEKSIINISGGVLSGAGAWDNGVIYFGNDADSQSIDVGEYGIANMYGGTVDYLHAGGSGMINIFGGNVINSLTAWDLSIVNVFGYDLSKTSVGGSYNYGYVSGFWNDNTQFTIYFSTEGTCSHVHLIPESSSLIFLALGTLILRRRH
jgi:hypothetical protein